MTRERVARGLLWFAVLWWGISFGGQFFNAMMVVPYFSHQPPALLEEWGRMRATNDGDFFAIFNASWIFLATFIAIFLMRTGSRRWAIASAVAAALSFAIAFRMDPMIARLLSPGQGGRTAAESVVQLRTWTHMNFLRLVVELLGFIFGIKAAS